MLMEDFSILADGFEDAFVGCICRVNEPPIAIYDHDKAVQILRERDGMNYDEALEFMMFNVAGAWVGKGTPGFLHKMSLEMFEEFHGE